MSIVETLKQLAKTKCRIENRAGTVTFHYEGPTFAPDCAEEYVGVEAIGAFVIFTTGFLYGHVSKVEIEGAGEMLLKLQKHILTQLGIEDPDHTQVKGCSSTSKVRSGQAN